MWKQSHELELEETNQTAKKTNTGLHTRTKWLQNCTHDCKKWRFKVPPGIMGKLMSLRLTVSVWPPAEGELQGLTQALNRTQVLNYSHQHLHPPPIILLLTPLSLCPLLFPMSLLFFCFASPSFFSLQLFILFPSVTWPRCEFSVSFLAPSILQGYMILVSLPSNLLSPYSNDSENPRPPQREEGGRGRRELRKGEGSWETLRWSGGTRERWPDRYLLTGRCSQLRV